MLPFQKEFLLLLQKCLSSNFELTTLNTVKSKEFVLSKYFKLQIQILNFNILTPQIAGYDCIIFFTI